MSALSRAAQAKRERLGLATAQVDRALFRLGQQGLARLSRRAVTELGALVQTVHNAGMVKVERDLEALATTVTRYLDRDPLFTPARYLELLRKLHLLNHAARAAFETGKDLRELTDLLGTARRTYVMQDEPVVVQALGATGWVTDSDFVGITVTLKWGERLLQLSNARPAAYFGNEPKRLLRMALSEYVDTSIQRMSHGAWRLDFAKVSEDGRVSVHADLQIRPAPYQGAAAYSGRSAATWDDLVALLAADASHPLRSTPSAMVLIEPVKYGVVIVDEKRSEAVLPVWDAFGAELVLRVPIRPENNLLIDNLQTLVRRVDWRPQGLFGRASAGEVLSFFPMTAVYGRPVKIDGMDVNELHLSLEDLERVTW